MHGVGCANRCAKISGDIRVMLCGQLRRWRCRTRSLPGEAVKDCEAGKHRAAIVQRAWKVRCHASVLKSLQDTTPLAYTIATRFVKNIHSLTCGLAIIQGWWPLIEAYLQAHVRHCLALFDTSLAEDGLGVIIHQVLETLGHARKDVKHELHTPLVKLGLPCFTKVVDVAGDALVLCLDQQGVEAARAHSRAALTEVWGIAVWQRWGCIDLPW
jgi:hypothetical protein